MTITSVQYANTEKSSFIVIDNGTIMYVPDDELNRERQMIDQWLETSGNTIAAYVAPPVPIPGSVSNYQARTLLIEQGLLSKIDTAIRGADQTVPKNQIALAAWDYANDFYRNSALVESMGAVLGLTDAQMDQMFLAASQIV